MKIQKSSRITALFLALVMILPLISIPAFAVEAESNVIWSQNFDNIAVGNYMPAGDGDAVGKIKQNGNNKYWELPFFAYDNAGNPTTVTCTCGLLDDGTDGDAWNMRCNCGNINSNIKAENVQLSYQDYDVVTFSVDYYIPTGAYGHITSQFRRGVSGMNGETAQSDVQWKDIVMIDCRDASTATVSLSSSVYSFRKAVTVNRDEWFTVNFVINLDTGAVRLYADGKLAGAGSYGLTNITIGSTQWTVFKPTDQVGSKPVQAEVAKYDGVACVDNLKIYSGDENWGQAYLYEEGFEHFTVGQKLENTDMGNKDANAPFPPTVTVAQDASKALKYETSIQGTTDKYFVGTATNSNGGTKKTVSAFVLGGDGKPTKVTVDGVEYDVSELATACGRADKRKTGITITTTTGDTTTTTNYYLFNAYEWEYYFGGDVVDKMILAKNPEISYANFDSVVFELKYYISADFKADLELQFYQTNNGNYKAFYSVYGYNELVYLSVDADKSAPLNRGAWNTVSMVLNLDTGMYDVYVNGRKASDSTKQLDSKGNWIIKANMWSLAKVSKSKCTADSGYIMIDDLCIYEGTAPSKATTDIYYNGFEQYEANSTVVGADATYITYAYKDGASNEKAATIDATKGSNALKLFYESAKQANGTSRTFYNVDKNFRFANPKLSYTDMDSVVFDFNVFIPETSSGAIHVRYGSVYASGDYYYKQGAENVIIKDGEGNAQAVNNEAQAWTPDLFRLEYYTAGQDAIFSGAHNGLAETASIKVNEWATLSVVVNLKDATVTGYANGVLVYSGSIMFQKSMQDRTVDGNLGYLATNPDDTTKTITVYEYTVEGNKVYKTGAGVEIDAKWLQYNAKVSSKDVVVLKHVDGDTVTWKTPAGVEQTPDDGNTPTIKSSYVWYWVKNPSNVTLNASQLLITGFVGMKNKNGVGGDLLVDDIAIYAGNTPKNAVFVADDFAGIVETEEKTQVRLSTKSGLRFATEIDTDMLADLQALEGIQNVKIGTLIAPERYLTAGTELTVDSLTRAGKAMLKVEATIDNYYTGNIDEDPATTHFVGSIVDILPTNIGQNFCARGYVEITMDSGLVVYIYSETIATQNVQAAADAVVNLIGEENLVATYGETYAQILLNYQAGLPANA